MQQKYSNDYLLDYFKYSSKSYYTGTIRTLHVKLSIISFTLFASFTSMAYTFSGYENKRTTGVMELFFELISATLYSIGLLGSALYLVMFVISIYGIINSKTLSDNVHFYVSMAVDAKDYKMLGRGDNLTI